MEEEKKRKKKKEKKKTKDGVRRDGKRWSKLGQEEHTKTKKENSEK